MKSKGVGAFFIMALLLSATGLMLINLASANFICYLPIIVINSDGSVVPQTEYIRQDGNVYTLTADVIQEYAIKIQRSNIVFDGAGHTIDGSLPTLGYANKGFVVQGVTNVTVKNLEVTGFIDTNIEITSCSEISVLKVKTPWLFLSHSDFNTIAESNIGNYRMLFANNSVITENNISFLSLRGSDNSVVTKNNVTTLWVIGGGAYRFFKNNFACEENYFEFGDTANFWDNGSVGNYWSDYEGADVNGDGIGDTPYVINAANQDRYPLMKPWQPTIPFDTVPPRIAVSSPESKVYNDSSVPLVFSIYESSSSMSYSLDGQDNITIAGNTTLSELPNGSHDLTVYVTDRSGNTGVSETIYFSVKVPFPTTWVVAAIAIAITGGSALAIYYFKKPKRKRQ